MWLFLSIYPLGLLFFLIHFFKQSERTKAKFIELFLLYQLVFSVGVTSLMAFIGLTFMADYIAKFTDWAACPFEQQLANVNLGYGILGILSIWFRGYFWMATILGFSVWILGDGFQHFYHFIMMKNASEGNVGVPLYTDFIIPIVLLIFLFLYLRQPKNEKNLHF